MRGMMGGYTTRNKRCRMPYEMCRMTMSKLDAIISTPRHCGEPSVNIYKFGAYVFSMRTKYRRNNNMQVMSRVIRAFLSWS
jgi:hypothetical protein